jgi:signal transduction histidine kinase
MELSKSNLLLSEVNAELDNFLYKTSHDIRGPIATMQGLCNLGLIDSKDPVVTSLLNQMVGQSDRMSKILGRLTTISNISQAPLRPEEIDFSKMLDSVLAGEKENARSKNVHISYELDPPLQIVSDGLMIRTILENLVNNGIKFCNNSTRIDSFVKVRVSQQDSLINMRVIDNGIGIGGTESDGMFHIFTRASERSETGGVGLYLSKLCSHKIGGQIRIEKSDDDGTIFLIQLPVDLAAVLEKRRLLQEDMQRILEEENTQKAKLVSFT